MNLLFMKRQIAVFIVLFLFCLPLRANPPGRGDVNASAGVVSTELTETKRKNAGGPDWTYYIWISAAFVLVAIVGLTENLINAEREKVKRMKSNNAKQMIDEHYE